MPAPRSILVVLPTWVGDFVMATPAVRTLREHFPKTRITFLTEPNLRELIRGGPWMDACIEWPEKKRRSPLHREYRQMIRSLRGERFDWALLLPNAFRAAATAWLAGAKRRIGYDRDGRGILLTDRIPVRNRRPRRPPLDVDPATALNPPQRDGGHYVPMRLTTYYADLLESIGCPRPSDRLELFTTPDCDDSVQRRLASLGLQNARPLVVISPGARYGAAKCWPPDRFAALADRLVDQCGAAIVITCGPGEEPLARNIAENMRNKGHVLDDPRLTLGEIKSLIRRCDLLVGNDTGPRHIGKAFGVAVLTVFGPTHPEWTATDYPRERIVRIDVPCGPCQQRICPLKHLDCMTGVSVDAVFAAASDLLTSAAPLGVSPPCVAPPSRR